MNGEQEKKEGEENNTQKGEEKKPATLEELFGNDLFHPHIICELEDEDEELEDQFE